jgi:hypothetical protein
MKNISITISEFPEDLLDKIRVIVHPPHGYIFNKKDFTEIEKYIIKAVEEKLKGSD